MKITTLELFPAKPCWIFLKLNTDDGRAGWGEVPGGEFPRTMLRLLEDLAATLAGQSLEALEPAWQARVRAAGPRGDLLMLGALTGLDLALWDLKGKAFGVPVWQLLGGAVRPRVRLGAPCGGITAADTAFQVKGLRLKGYTAVTMELDEPAAGGANSDPLERIVARLAAIRAELGPHADVGIQAHARLNPAQLRRLLPLLEPHAPRFLEAPYAPGQLAEQAAAAAHTPLPFAVGGPGLTRWNARPALEARAAGLLRPDTATTGGPLELRRLAALAEPFGVPLAPVHTGGPIGLAAALHAAVGIPNLLALEHPALTNKWDLGLGYLATTFTPREGGLEPPKGPGLGVAPIEAALHERAFDPDAPAPARGPMPT